MDRVSSPEKNDNKISNFGRGVLILEHTIADHVEFKNFNFSAKSWQGKHALRLVIIVNDKPINLLCQWAFFTSPLVHHKGNRR